MTSKVIAGIGWKQLQGRKNFYKLHPAMLSPAGLIRDLDVRPVPFSDSHPKGTYSVLFDRDYAVRKLAYELEDCAAVPLLDLVELLVEAYTIVNPDAPIVGVMAEIKGAVSEVPYFDPLSLSGSW
jgi:hypothetical protein